MSLRLSSHLGRLLFASTVAAIVTVGCGDDDDGFGGGPRAGAGGAGGAGGAAGAAGGTGGEAGMAGMGGTPTRPPSDWLASSNGHTCVIVTGGEVRCWGVNRAGQLGDGTTIDRPYPVAVERAPGVPLTGAVAIALGPDQSCAIVEGGKAFCWGASLTFPLGAFRPYAEPVLAAPGAPIEGVLAIAPGHEHACVLTAERRVRCWGSNFDGELGDGTTSASDHPVPVLVSPTAALGPASAIAVGQQVSCAIDEGGKVLCWGAARPTLGGNVEVDETMLTPQPLADATGATLVGARALAGSDDRICALLDGGRVTCWKTFESEGHSGSGATGYFRPRPLETSPGVPLTGARAFSLDDFTVCALAEGGGAQCQAFDYATQTFLPPEPAERAPGVPLAGVAALGINCALLPGPASPSAPGEPTPLEGHEVYCWGENRAGQLGDGTTIAQAYAVRVDLSRPVALGGATSLALGGGHSCALVAGGELACWGENEAGSLGQGTTVDRPFPMPVAASNSARFAGAQAVALGDARGCVLQDGGKVSCWGANALGQVGDGTTTDRPYPVPVELAPGVPLTGVTSLDVRSAYACALADGGAVRCWGANDRGQLGDRTLVDRLRATLVGQ